MSEPQYQPDLVMSPEEYLAFEEESHIRHEYVQGRVWAMAGESDVHNTITLNIASELRAQLRGKQCRVFMENVKCLVHAPDHDYLYPDVMVACDPTDNARLWRERPSVIFEVRSPSTRDKDFYKFFAYQTSPALELFVMVEQDRVALEVFQRQAGGNWERFTLDSLNAALALEVIGCTLKLTQIYEATPLLPAG